MATVINGRTLPRLAREFDKLVARGFSHGVGDRQGQMCVEAAICAVLGLPHGDNPPCVASAVRTYKIRLNDSSRWQSARSRAAGLRDLGIAQLGSAGVVDNQAFAQLLALRTILERQKTRGVTC